MPSTWTSLHYEQDSDRFLNFAWQEGYGAFTVSVSQLERVIQYVRSQADHHRTVSFQDEYTTFLRRHGFNVDEVDIWH